MSTIAEGADSDATWSVLAREDWETADDLLVSLSDAVEDLDSADETVLYDHVAVDAVLDAVAPGSESRGVSELRFAYGRYEIRITDAGVIAAAPPPAPDPRASD